MQSVEKIIVIPEEEQNSFPVFYLVRELLTLTVERLSDAVNVEPRDFYFDQKTVFKTSASLNVLFACEGVVEKENNIKFILSGTVENQGGQKEAFILHCNMWCDTNATTSITNNGRKFYGTHSLLMEFANKEELLTDTIFGLTFSGKDSNTQQYQIGHGKGFLLFVQDQDINVNKGQKDVV